MKRETGGSPVRTRHCEQIDIVHMHVCMEKVKAFSSLETGRRYICIRICEPGDLPVVLTWSDHE